LVIDQGDFELVEPDQRVEIMLAQSADYVYVSKIERKSTEALKSSPTHLSSLHGGELPTQMSPNGVPRPLNTVFEAIAPLDRPLGTPERNVVDDAHRLMRIGLVGKAKISTRPRTLFDRLARYISRTFNFTL
jgi:hypothetical protein